MDGPGPIHASCVAIDGAAILIMGPSGSGKSDLCLRLIDRGALLVSDDYTEIRHDEGSGRIIASPPATIAGKLEVRGLGILSLPHVDSAPVTAAVALVSGHGDGVIERLPLEQDHLRLCGRDIPLMRLNAFEASAPIKLEYALRAFAITARVAGREGRK
ncbi:MAG: HPr kinase/phosphorylase [Sphingobium sp.]